MNLGKSNISHPKLNPKPIQQQYYNSAIKFTKQDKKRTDLGSVKSTEKSKCKLRNLLLKNKKLITEQTYHSPRRKIIPNLNSQSDYKIKNDKDFIKSKENPNKISVIKFNSVTQKVKNDNPEVIQSQKRQKRQFKLIHRMKKERNKKKQQNLDNQKSVIVYQHNLQTQFPGLKTMLKSAEQLQQVLQPAQEISSLQILITQEKKQYKSLLQKQLSGVIQNLKRSSCILKQSNENTKESNKSLEEQQQKKIDLNRSKMRAKQVLKNRRDSIGLSNSQYSINKSKVIQQMSLALYSRSDSKLGNSRLFRHFVQSKTPTTLDKLQTHISILKSLSNFVVESTSFDANTSQWQELNFLIFKKYYIQRLKILNFIKRYPMKNPFNLYNAQISSKQIIEYMKRQQSKVLKQQISVETRQIKQKLISIYNRFEKNRLGERINLFECDNFSNWVIEQLWAEIILTEYDTIHQREQINIRLCRIFQTIFLISELNGRYEFPFEEAEEAINTKEYQKYIKQAKQAFQKYILYQNF